MYRITCVHHEDITNERKMKQALIGIDAIVHLAGVNRSDSSYDIYYGNVLPTLQLMENVIRYAPLAKIIYASSIQVYDKKSFYGIAKSHAESIIQWYSRRYDIYSVILRFSNIYGPFCKPFYNSVIATFLYQAVNGQELIIYGKGDQKRDFLYVSDAVNAIQKSLDYISANRSIIRDVKSGMVYSIEEVVAMIQKHTLLPVKIIYMKGNKEKKQKSHVCIHPVNIEMGWEPRVSLGKGIQNIFKEEYGNFFKKT